MRNAKWKPDDSFHDLVNGEFKGVLRVKQALKRLKITVGDRIVTSRDPDMLKITEELRRTTLPDGFEQWQLPIILGGASSRPVMSFITIGRPGAALPRHRHKNDCLLRIILSGSILFNDLELIPGDWMHVPTGMPYAFKAGRLGCVVMHLYNGAGLYAGSLPENE